MEAPALRNITDQIVKRHNTHMTAHLARELGENIGILEAGLGELLKSVQNTQPLPTARFMEDLGANVAVLEMGLRPLQKLIQDAAAAPPVAPPRTPAAAASPVDMRLMRTVRDGVQDYLRVPPRGWAKPPMIVDRHTTVHQLTTPLRVQDGVEVIAVIHHAASAAPVAVVLEHQPGQPQCTLRLVPVYDDKHNKAEVIAANTAAHNAALDACDRPLKSVRGADGRRRSGAQRRPRSVTH